MRNRKVTFRLGETVGRLEESAGPPKGAVTLLESGTRIVSELVLSSIGRLGQTDSLNQEAVGLETDDRGRLDVDDKFRTSVTHIFAAGDVVGFPSLTVASREQGRQGRLPACHAFGVPAGPMAKHFPISIYSIPEMSVVGVSERELTEQKVPYDTGVAWYREIALGQIIGEGSGLLKILIHREDRRLLGVHAIVTGATELTRIGEAMLGLDGGLDYLLETVFNYPTLDECYRVAALDAFYKLSH